MRRDDTGSLRLAARTDSLARHGLSVRREVYLRGCCPHATPEHRARDLMSAVPVRHVPWMASG
jgi:hypothetical protein